jgi:hypothetical protein
MRPGLDVVAVINRRADAATGRVPRERRIQAPAAPRWRQVDRLYASSSLGPHFGREWYRGNAPRAQQKPPLRHTLSAEAIPRCGRAERVSEDLPRLGCHADHRWRWALPDVMRDRCAEACASHVQRCRIYHRSTRFTALPRHYSLTR